ncbi:NAD(P)/FAD-dependent oxidoreductase [Enterovirga sp.]|jgi:thioredoxin reductase (NADPH)|uniref:NAD(P)/FAD-dependent oxidoreductase n=1 Tax=Enterovirga sp. TaxID=2026350 RepID=UPI00263529B8|nr:NAD(P)/FAD-dependent oxidoreductase [Enterovirga sp.]MDB5592335.1 putative Thioredoxin reductase [Enterovirga sp.]
MPDSADDLLDCLVIGGGPAGLTAALYLARFHRRFLVVDAGASRAASIPTSHNIPFFEDGIGGPDILARHRAHLARYDVVPVAGEVSRLEKSEGCFWADVVESGGGRRVRARRVLLATGSADVEPDLPDLPDAIRRGLVRYCPICDGYEAAGKRIGVLGYGAQGLGEAVFVARTYSRDVTLLTLGQPMELDAEQEEQVRQHGIRVVPEQVEALEHDGRRISAIRAGGADFSFEVLYSALGLRHRSDLALALGADHDSTGALLVDDHNQTSVPGLYAAGGAVRGLDQIVVAMGHAAVAATHIHNRCELPTENEPAETGRGHTGP